MINLPCRTRRVDLVAKTLLQKGTNCVGPSTLVAPRKEFPYNEKTLFEEDR